MQIALVSLATITTFLGGVFVSCNHNESRIEKQFNGLARLVDYGATMLSGHKHSRRVSGEIFAEKLSKPFERGCKEGALLSHQTFKKHTLFKYLFVSLVTSAAQVQNLLSVEKLSLVFLVI